MQKRPVIIDCDPGTDDIAALLLARNMECFDVRAVTPVAGNTELEFTLRNTLQLLSFMDWKLPVGKGADAPLFRPLETAEYIHGKGGMMGLKLPDATMNPSEKPAWDLIYEIAVECGGTLEIVAVGPLTNIAIALMKHPDLSGLIKKIVIMGGAFLAGNTTPAAEFNIYVDPEAAKRVFESGIPFYLCPLDVTHEGYLTAGEFEEIAAFGSKEAKFFAEVAGGRIEKGLIYTKGCGAALHDPLALLFAENDEYFEYEECFIGVETEGTVTRGRTVTDCYSDKQLFKNGYLVKSVDRARFVERIKQLMRQYT